MLAGGVRCVSGEQVRHRQRRKDANIQIVWTKGQHTDSRILERICCTCLPSQQEEESGTYDSVLEHHPAEHDNRFDVVQIKWIFRIN